MVSEYKDDLQEARERLVELLRKREMLEVDIAKQQSNVAALATLADESEETDEVLEMNLGGLTSACRIALRAAGKKGLTPREVRKALTNLHFPIGEYKNPLASIHTVLKRFVKSGEAKRILNLKDGTKYKWVSGRTQQE